MAPRTRSFPGVRYKGQTNLSCWSRGCNRKVLHILLRRPPEIEWGGSEGEGEGGEAVCGCMDDLDGGGVCGGLKCICV